MIAKESVRRIRNVKIVGIGAIRAVDFIVSISQFVLILHRPMNVRAEVAGSSVNFAKV
jgi:hypothetical protein